MWFHLPFEMGKTRHMELRTPHPLPPAPPGPNFCRHFLGVPFFLGGVRPKKGPKCLEPSFFPFFSQVWGVLTKHGLKPSQIGRPSQNCSKKHLGVDQKVLARSYVFGDHSSWLKSLRERSAMEFAKETYCFAKDSALDSWRHACALTYLQIPLPCRYGDTQNLHLHY